MKSATLLFIMTFLSLVLVGCDQKSVKSSSSNSNNINNCTLYPYSTGCVGTTTGSTTGGTTTSCTTQAYQPICPNYTAAYQSCYYNPTQSFCSGFCTTYPSTPYCGTSTTGGTTGTNGNTYGSLYPQGVPSGSCTYTSTSGYDTESATMTIVGGSWMNPGATGSSSYVNTSYSMMSASAAKSFLVDGTDAVMRARLKVRPQPESAGSGANGVCYGRTTGASIPGYTKLKFNVKIASVNAPTTLYTVASDVEVGVNSCSSGYNLRSYKGNFPEGYFVVITDVRSNQGCSNYNWSTGFQNCQVWDYVRTKDCWSMELEVAKDGTKTF